jgi:hypothetical protein
MGSAQNPAVDEPLPLRRSQPGHDDRPHRALPGPLSPGSAALCWVSRDRCVQCWCQTGALGATAAVATTHTVTHCAGRSVRRVTPPDALVAQLGPPPCSHGRSAADGSPRRPRRSQRPAEPVQSQANVGLSFRPFSPIAPRRTRPGSRDSTPTTPASAGRKCQHWPAGLVVALRRHYRWNARRLRSNRRCWASRLGAEGEIDELRHRFHPQGESTSVSHAATMCEARAARTATWRPPFSLPWWASRAGVLGHHHACQPVRFARRSGDHASSRVRRGAGSLWRHRRDMVRFHWSR